MDSTSTLSEKFNPLAIAWQGVNLVLLFLMVILVPLAFFALQEIVTMLAAFFILQVGENTVREGYVVVTIRNAWACTSGVLLLGFVIYSMEQHIKHLSSLRTSKILLATIVIELLISSFHLLV